MAFALIIITAIVLSCALINPSLDTAPALESRPDDDGTTTSTAANTEDITTPAPESK